MDYTKFILSNRKAESISIQRVKAHIHIIIKFRLKDKRIQVE